MTPQDQPPAPTVAQVITGMRRTVELARQHGGKIDWAYVETWANQLTALQPPPDPPAPTLRALIEQKIEQWREKATGYAKRYGDADAEAWNTFVATRMGALQDCADELAALLTETDGPAPQNGTTNQTGTGETTRS
jgi:hypothetical protein